MLRKFILGLVCGIALTVTTAVYASDTIQAYLFPVKFEFNGENKEIDNNEYVVLNHNGRVYVPLRFVAENMGATVAYQEMGGNMRPQIIVDYPTESGILIKDPQEDRVSIGNLQMKTIRNEYPTYVTGQLKLISSPYPLSAVHFTLSFYDEERNLIEQGDGVGQMMKPGDIQTVTVHAGALKNYSSVALTVDDIIDITHAGRD